MEIKQAEFTKSSTTADQCPKQDRLEFAFIGRSNVGKSSLINMLCNRKSLAKTSSTPGKTQLINHFLINNEWFLVDLPGYGYAKVSKKLRSGFSKIITDYLANRPNLICLFILIDSRLPLQAIDLEFMNKMGEDGIPFVLVFTKTDKLSKTKYEEYLETYHAELSTHWDEVPAFYHTSSTKKTGKEELLTFIETLIVNK